MGCGLDKLSWSEIRSLIKDVFKESHVAITVYVVPQQNPTPKCDLDVEDVGSGKEECPSGTPSGSEYINEWIDRSQQSEWRHLDERGWRVTRSENSENPRHRPVKRGASQPSDRAPYEREKRTFYGPTLTPEDDASLVRCI